MSTLPDDTLRRILQQIQQTAANSHRALNISRAQVTQKEREKKILQLTIGEITAIPQDEGLKMYKGVGKMFLQVPRPAMENGLKAQEKDLSDEINALQKKSKYLEKQFMDSQNQLRDIFHAQDKEG